MTARPKGITVIAAQEQPLRHKLRACPHVRQPTTNDHRQPTTNDDQPTTNDHGQPTTNHGQPTTDNRSGHRHPPTGRPAVHRGTTNKADQSVGLWSKARLFPPDYVQTVRASPSYRPWPPTNIGPYLDIAGYPRARYPAVARRYLHVHHATLMTLRDTLTLRVPLLDIVI